MLLDMKKIVCNQKGMTLIELLVTLTLVVVVTTLLAAIFKEGLVSYDRTVSEADVQLSVRHQSDVILENIRTSKIGVINEVSYPQSEPEKLTLFTGTEDLPATITYFKDGTSILRQVDDEPAETVFQNVIQFNVSLDSQSVVTITVKTNPSSSRYQESMAKEIVLQAKPRAALPTLSN